MTSAPIRRVDLGAGLEQPRIIFGMELLARRPGDRDPAAIAVPQRQGEAHRRADRVIVGGIAGTRHGEREVGELVEHRLVQLGLGDAIAGAQCLEIEPALDRLGDERGAVRRHHWIGRRGEASARSRAAGRASC